MGECELEQVGPPRKGLGGPKTGPGKRRSRGNARKHGCRSKEKFLPGERRADYEALWAEWLAHYEPETDVEVAQLERLVDAQWHFRRTERAYLSVERALRKQWPDAAEWSGPLLAQLALMQRYRTTAENSFDKALRALEFMRERQRASRREQERMDQQYERDRAEWTSRQSDEVVASFNAFVAKREAEQRPVKTAADEVFAGQNCLVEATAPVRLEQCVEVRVVDGATVTTYAPANAELVEWGRAMLPRPQVVYRYLNLPDGVPAEYEWVGVTGEQQRRDGLSGVQRMTAEEWLAAVAREESVPGGHAGPAARWVPRKRWGQCACALCRCRAATRRLQLEAVRWR